MSHSPGELWVDLGERRSDPRREVIRALRALREESRTSETRDARCGGFVNGEEEGTFNHKLHPLGGVVGDPSGYRHG